MQHQNMSAGCGSNVAVAQSAMYMMSVLFISAHVQFSAKVPSLDMKSKGYPQFLLTSTGNKGTYAFVEC